MDLKIQMVKMMNKDAPEDNGVTKKNTTDRKSGKTDKNKESKITRKTEQRKMVEEEEKEKKWERNQKQEKEETTKKQHFQNKSPLNCKEERVQLAVQEEMKKQLKM